MVSKCLFSIGLGFRLLFHLFVGQSLMKSGCLRFVETSLGLVATSFVSLHNRWRLVQVRTASDALEEGFPGCLQAPLFLSRSRLGQGQSRHQGETFRVFP